MSDLRKRFAMSMRLAKGGYCYVHNILDGERVVGTITDYAETRTSPIKTTFALGDDSFDTAAEFIAAYDARKKAVAA